MSDSPPPSAPEAPPAEPGDPDATAGPDETAEEPPRRKLRNWQLVALTLVAVAFLVGAYLLGKGGGDDTPDAASPPTSVAPAPAPDGYSTFQDDLTGTSLSYPGEWEKLDLPADGEQRLVVTPGGENSVSIRSTPVGFNVAADDLEQAKQETDELLADQGLTEVLEQETLTVNGLSAIYYRYNFTDSELGLQGIHEHFFVFHGGYMTQLVFQALPTTEYPALSETFARIATTFRAPDPPAKPLPAAPTSRPSTTATPATSTP